MIKDWSEVILSKVCTKIGSGATPRGGKDVYLDDGPYTLIRSQNIYNDGFYHDSLVFISERHAGELQKVEVLEGDVLLNITGDSVARVCQVTQDVLPARVNQHVAIIRPDSVSLDASYLRYYRASPEMQTLLLSWAGSGGTRNALTKGMLESLVIPTPPLPEQRAIVHILDTLDDKIELNPREPMQKGTAAPYLEMAALPTTGSSPDDTVLRGFKSGARFRNGDTLLARITPCLENGKTTFLQLLPKDAVGWSSTEFIVMRAIPPFQRNICTSLAVKKAFENTPSRA